MAPLDVRPLRVALTQWHATDDPSANVEVALRLVGKAAAEGADLVLLPENGLMLGTGPQMREHALTLGSPEVLALRAAAAAAGVGIVLGGVKLREDDRIRNAALVIDAQGRLVGRYDKIHLFDARVAGLSFEASRVEEAGADPVLIELDGWSLGLTICYDIRFPELFRGLALAGAEVLLVPSAFTKVTGQAHWETLLRARAIENGSYVVASATVTPDGVEGDAFETYGHAMVVDPWGVVIADLATAPEAFSVVELDPTAVERARTALPVLAQRRPDAYAAEPRRLVLTTRGTDHG